MRNNLLLHIYFNDNFKEIDVSALSIPVIMIGSGSKDTIRLEGAGLSEGHASLEKNEDGIWLNSCGHAVFQNGLKVNKKKIAAGDVFILEKRNSKTALMIKEKSDFPEPLTAFDLKAANTVTIGRGNDNNIIINDMLVSENHAVVTQKSGRYYIRDCGSTNGVYINGKRTKEKQLNDGDIITICGNKLRYFNDSMFIASANDSVRVKGLRPIRKIKPAYPYFQRPPRMIPEMPEGEMIIAAPPLAGTEPSVNWLVVLLPAIGMMMVPLILILASMGSTSSGSSSSYMLLYLIMGPISLITAIATYTSQKGKFKKDEEKRKDSYSKYIEQKNAELIKLHDLQRNALIRAYPDFKECMNIAEKKEHSLWERLPVHADFLSIRLGSGNVPFNVNVKLSDTQQTFGEEDELVKNAKGLITEFREISKVPVFLPLQDNISVGGVGDRASILNFTRNTAAFIAATHSYDEVKMGVVCPAEEYEKWSFMRWLPHIWDDGFEQRYFAKDRRGVQKTFSSLLDIVKARDILMKNIGSGLKYDATPVYVLFVADGELVRNEPLLRFLVQNRRELGIITFFLFDKYENLPKDCNCIINVSGTRGEVLFKDGNRHALHFETESVDIDEAEKFCRILAPVRISNLTAAQTLPKAVTLFQMLELKDINKLDIISRWRANEPYLSLAADVGLMPGGIHLQVDLHEKAHGPHGLVAGTTGSGKSEFIQTLILSLALNYHPHELAFILIDYKGGGMANLFRQLPHVCGIITNLGGNQTDRALASIKGEVARRQAFFDKVGVNHIDKYLKLFRGKQTTETMPHLVIIIDEFAELKDEKPEFISELVSTARVGRSYGIHLILATQKPSGVVDAQIWSNARFKVCFKVQNTEDSKEMLKRPDAAAITVPGRGYLQVGNDEVFELFHSAWSGAEYHDGNDNDLDSIKEVELDGTRQPIDRSIFKNDKKEYRTELSCGVDLICIQAGRAGIKGIRGPWLPPLPDKIFLQNIMLENSLTQDWNTRREASNWACACAGLVDNPSAQSQYPLIIDFVREGHVVVIGSPSSGKTTLLKTLVVSLALSNSPEDVWFYLLDFGGRTLNVFEGMPHTGAVIKPEEEEKLKNFSRMVSKELENRKRLFAELGTASVQAYREHGQNIPAMFIVIDNIAALLEGYPEIEELLVQISREGGSLGIFMVITAHTSSSVKYKIMSNIKRILALQLTDRSEYISLIGRGAIEPLNLPGRGLIKADSPLEFQTALSVPGTTEVEQSRQIKALCDKMTEAWHGKPAAQVPVVPALLTTKQLLNYTNNDKIEEEYKQLPLGLDIELVQPVYFNLKHDEGLLIVGQSRNSILVYMRALVQMLAYSSNPGKWCIYIIDFPSREFKALSGGKELSGYAVGRDDIEEIFKGFASHEVLQEKVIEDNSEEPKEVFIIICDYKDFAGKACEKEKEILEGIIRNDSARRAHVIMAGTTTDLGACWDGPGKAMKDNGVGVLLSEPNEQQVFNIRLPYNIKSKPLRTDEGYFIDHTGARRIKLPLEQI